MHNKNHRESVFLHWTELVVSKLLFSALCQSVDLELAITQHKQPLKVQVAAQEGRVLFSLAP